MKNYKSPKIEIEEVVVQDFCLASNEGVGGGKDEFPVPPRPGVTSLADDGSGVLTVGGLTGEGAVGSSLANNLFGIR